MLLIIYLINILVWILSAWTPNRQPLHELRRPRHRNPYSKHRVLLDQDQIQVQGNERCICRCPAILPWWKNVERPLGQHYRRSIYQYLFPDIRAVHIYKQPFYLSSDPTATSNTTECSWYLCWPGFIAAVIRWVIFP